jgi:hypothetical protein
VPVFLASTGSEPAPPQAVAEQTAAELAPENQSAVLAYNPGLRDYKKRLDNLQSKDPFVQQYSGAGAAAAALEQTVPSISSGVTTDTGSSGGSDLGGSGGSGGSGGGGGGKSGKVTTYYWWYETDVKVGEAGSEERKNKVDPFDFLPSETAPVLVFLGTLTDGKTAVFLVAKDVLSMDGSGDCFPSPESCQLLAMKAGESSSLVWGIDSKTYNIKVIRIEKVVSRKPPK